MNIPSAETLRLSAVDHLRQTGEDAAAHLLSRCKLEVESTNRLVKGRQLGLNVTVRCEARDLQLFEAPDDLWCDKSEVHFDIQKALNSVLPADCTVHVMQARSKLINPAAVGRQELERLIEAQKETMIDVATGTSIRSKDDEYKERRSQIKSQLDERGIEDPNPFADLWGWYGRWRSGDLPTYQSRREYIANLYQPLLDEIIARRRRNPATPLQQPTGWQKVDRVVDRLVSDLGKAKTEEEFQSLGLLCRECLISLAQVVYDPKSHVTSDGVTPSNTDAARMLEAYFSAEYSGSGNEALRKHAKAALTLAVALQHKRTATYRDAALSVEATRTVVNIVAITSGKR